ncbi:MAG: tRNA (adenosine(37)-N6)-threonylcarbamoyltransferase complex transferase subunit TsaD, partial [bacterium]|nr:tRNA (adenosine(37)-N6)-threonylcarbamoyltransferase complex transferase subunit TsaD [bacterium]
ENKKISGFRFPTIALIVSGGHTQLILMKNWGKYKLIGETRDDAAGECFDKSARLLGLGYPGGPAISAAAEKFKIKKSKIKIKLPRPMLNSQDFDFSFSGLKTAVLYLVEKLKKEKKNIKNLIPALANEIQNSINEVLIAKTIKAAKKYKVKSVILGGGVAANASLRNQLAKTIKNELPDVSYFCPERKFSTDNAAMIALTAYFNLKNRKRKTNWKNLEADANLRLKEIK